MGYFRTWHDYYAWPEGESSNKMIDVPQEVDVVFVFVDYTGDDTPFWGKLKNEYVPKLNAQGTWVVRTCGILDIDGSRGVSKKFDGTYGAPKTEEDYKKLAQMIIDEYVDKCNLDGLDIDFEYHDGPYSARKARIVGVVKELEKLLHAQNKLLILDTNMGATDSTGAGIFIATKDSWDFVLRQTYRSGWTTGFNTYKGLIPKNKYLTGFSFYEENGNQWNDVPSVSIVADDDTNALKPGMSVENLMQNADFKGCHAYKMAEWAATGGYGGCFSYAIDRDGIRHGNNKKFFKVSEGGQPTQYLFSKALKKVMQEKYQE